MNFNNHSKQAEDVAIKNRGNLKKYNSPFLMAVSLSIFEILPLNKGVLRDKAYMFKILPIIY
jgi:hypothetical protein